MAMEKSENVQNEKRSLSNLARTLIWLSDQKQPPEVIALYLFYYKTAIWQHTDQPKAVDNYCMKGLGLGWKRFYRAKKELLGLGLIEQIQQDRKKDKFGDYYVRVYFHRSLNIESPVINKELEDHDQSEHIDNPPMSPLPVPQKGDINALRKRKDINTHLLSRRQKEYNITSPDGKSIACPFKHKIGFDFDQYKECDICTIYNECFDESTRLKDSSNQ
jgi:hypothetical protein